MSSALRSLIPPKARRAVFIGGAIVALLAVVFGFMFNRANAVFAAVLVGLVVVAGLALTWFVIWRLTKASRLKRQRHFDASVAAREGIDDRKREWQSWVDELEKNDIDRYELPFYLLVGEPQSGKSVLLQNSDLKFLFGQSRLSGIGGTRGCDWWFTEEAVILDLAGRLFTHEGGAADEAEWEAFLDLINDFRPLDPANGIMLVIPCDSLLGESLETCGHKASKTREALLSLTRKLEAKLPIYVVLTKGDKIFGFAETVHRLPIEQRHQMFGWSRSAERLEEPFEPGELREAWDGMVGRSVALRDHMLATARVPEALPEVDRMLGFPAELEGLFDPLETYLKRIFQGSDLVEQLYFRGIYLTSGLQSGAPIAKVCIDILDRPGEADNRDLEKLFVRQQSYFIKDLVRKRVFAERGLVKPTSARVERAKRTAWTGYGVAAALALVSLVWGAIEIKSNLDESGQEEIDQAIASARRWTPSELAELRLQDPEQPKIASLLDTLESIYDVRGLKRTFLQALHGSRTESFDDLYEAVYDRVYRNRLQNLAAGDLATKTRDYAKTYAASDPTTRPGDHQAFVREARATAELLDGITSGDSARTIAAVLEGTFDLDRVERAHERRGDGFEPDADAARGDALAAAARLNELWDATLDPADPIRVDGSVGFCLAWYGMTTFDAQARMTDSRVTPGTAPSATFHDECARAARMLDVLREFTAHPSFEVSAVEVGAFQLESHALEALRARLVAASGRAVEPWRAKKDFVTWLGQNAMGRATLLADRRTSLPRESLAPATEGYLADQTLKQVVGATWLGPNATDTPQGMHEQIARGIALAGSDEALVRAIARVKLLLAKDSFVRTYGNFEALRAKMASSSSEDGLASIVAAQEAILALLDALAGSPADLSDLAAFRTHLEGMAREGVTALSGALDVTTLQGAAITVLDDTRAPVPDAAGASEEAIRKHLAAVRDALESSWTERSTAWDLKPTDPDASAIAREASAHLTEVDRLIAQDDDAYDSGRAAWEERTRSRLDQRLGVYGKRIEDAIAKRVDLSDTASLEEACRRISQQIIGDNQHEPLLDWVSALHGTLHVPLSTDPDLEAFYGRFPFEKRTRYAEYRRSSQTGSWLPADAPQEKVRLHALGFLDRTNSLTTGDPGALSGPDLAERFYAAQLVLTPPVDAASPQHGILLDLSVALARSLDAAVVRQLRGDYLEDLRTKIVRDSADEVAVFWHDRTTDAGAKSRHHEAVAHLFGDEGVYLSLVRSYGVIGRTDDDFRLDGPAIAADADLTDTPRRRWQFDVFLEEMLLYVRGASELAQLSTDDLPSHPLADLEAFEMSLGALAPSQQKYEETWNHWDAFESSLFTPSGRTSIQRGPDGRIIVTEPRLGWGFHEAKGFDLKWRDRVAGSGGAWQTYERTSCLEPLLLFWSDSQTWVQPEPRKQAKTATVEFQVTLDERAPFELTIKPAPPRRPALQPSESFGD